jgi:hypothetical protein
MVNKQPTWMMKQSISMDSAHVLCYRDDALHIQYELWTPITNPRQVRDHGQIAAKWGKTERCFSIDGVKQTWKTERGMLNALERMTNGPREQRNRS